MSKIRVLVVDDSMVIRHILSNELCKDPMLEVVGKAATGKIALSMIEQLKPDVVTMDIEMPEMNGLMAVKEIRKSHTSLPVIMFSGLSQHAARETLEALSYGANDYVTKPTNMKSAALAMQCVRQELIPKIKAHCSIRCASQAADSLSVPTKTQRTSSIASKVKGFQARIDVVAIGVSTGGPNALAEVLPLFPKDFPVPIVIVQHMPPVFTKCLSERLSSKSQIPVHEGVAGATLQPGQAWLAPGDYHMVVVRKRNLIQLELNQDRQENSCRPAVDVLFRSVAQVYGDRALAVVLTGMGQDGLRGCMRIREKGGKVIVQDEASSVVWGMPGAVVHAGLAEKILPLSKIANEIQRRVCIERVASEVSA